MTDAQTVILLVAAIFGGPIALVFAHHHLTNQRKLITMAVFAELEAPLAELAASIAALPAKIAAGDPAAAAQLAQDKADSVAAVQAQADALKTIAGA